MNVLLVEDNEEVRAITIEYLQELGHNVVAVADAERALELLTNSSFDVVMTDISLPGLSGIELARRLRTDHPGLPVIISSGYGAASAQALIKEHRGPVLILSKPYDLSELESVLARATAISSSNSPSEK